MKNKQHRNKMTAHQKSLLDLAAHFSALAHRQKSSRDKLNSAANVLEATTNEMDLRQMARIADEVGSTWLQAAALLREEADGAQ